VNLPHTNILMGPCEISKMTIHEQQALDLQAYYIKTSKVWSFNPKNQVYHQPLIEVQNSDKICDLQVQNV
jgi:hypothetical protein